MDSSPTSPTQPPPPTRSDVDSILKRKRKIREHKACYPCRTRKVKCDSNIPCKTCIDRKHADLCSFNPPSPDKRLDTGSTHSADWGVNGAADEGMQRNGELPLTREDWDRMYVKLGAMERNILDLKESLARAGLGRPGGGLDPSSASPGSSKSRNGPQYVKSMELSEQSHLSGETIHLGGGSVPALIMALRKGDGNRPAVQEVFGNSVLPLFALDNESATYPFVSLWGQPQGAAARVEELCKALPSDSECLESFQQYRDGAYVIYPAIAEIDKFESDLLFFLMNRRTEQQRSGERSGEYEGANDLIYGVPLRWVGLLFAALASGSQFSPNLRKKDRDLISQVYVCCSFECLRLINYISNASLEVIQTLLIMGNVLSNGMNAGAAWSLLGMTIRLAQTLGLHRSPEDIGSPPQQRARSKTWWAIIWQDSLLSLSYDRASSAATLDCVFPPSDARTPGGGKTYHECMYQVCKVGLDTVRNRVAPQSIEERLSHCGALRDEIAATRSTAAEHLRDFKACRSIKEQSEYWLLHLHASYMVSELCRPAISPTTADFDKSTELRKLCVENLMNTLDAYLGLANVSPIYTRSWSVTHRALSSALLLGILGEPLRDARAQQLCGRLCDALAGARADASDTSLSAPIARSISAISKLSAQGTRTPIRSDAAGGGAGQAEFEQQTQQQQFETQQEPVPPLQQQQQQQQQEEEALGMVNGEEGAYYFLPSPLSGFEDESSPYALMDSIIWGGSEQNRFNAGKQ